jgi:hypothetical protein
MKFSSALCLLLILVSFCSVAQTVAIKKVELIGDKVIVHYDLEDGNPNNEYLMSLYSSKDNFATALTKVTGDVGMEVKPGTNKRIEWSIIQEFGGYKGKLALEIKGKVYVPFVKLQQFDTKKMYRRGKSYELKWKPGSSTPINIELYNGGQRVAGETNYPNNGSYTLFIPGHAKPGKEYRLKISDPRSNDAVIFTPMFRVGAKVPLAFKIAPVVIVGAVAIIFLNKGGEEPGGGNENNTDNIETPPLPNG